MHDWLNEAGIESSRHRLSEGLNWLEFEVRIRVLSTVSPYESRRYQERLEPIYRRLIRRYCSIGLHGSGLTLEIRRLRQRRSPSSKQNITSSSTALPTLVTLRATSTVCPLTSSHTLISSHPASTSMRRHVTLATNSTTPKASDWTNVKTDGVLETRGRLTTGPSIITGQDQLRIDLDGTQSRKWVTSATTHS